MSKLRLAAAILFVAVLAMPARTSVAEPPDSSAPLNVFEQRIMPIFRSPEPSSCVQCHLAAVDLKDYIRPSHEATFTSLRDQGLLDLDAPEDSKILELIQMGDEDLDEGARLIHAQTRRAEYEAFAAWIKACCRDPKLRNLPMGRPDAAPTGPQAPLEVVRHARKSRVVDSFVRNIWSQRMRCYPCHTPHEVDDANPKHEKAISRAQELVARYGERMHIFHETPEATMDYLVAASRTATEDALPLINLEDPAKSLLVLKPTSRLPKQITKGKFEEPSSTEPVSHMGGLKMHAGDHSYKSFVAWIQDYARVVGNEYTSVADLPPDNWYPTKHVLILRNAPDDWPALATVQLFVHEQRDGKWREEPIAFTQGKVTPRRVISGMLFLLASPGSPSAISGDREDVKLEPGKYVVRAYLDTQGRLADDPALLLRGDAFRGEVEIDAKWGIGYPQAERVAGDQFRRSPP
jgi:hypothetical protein